MLMGGNVLSEEENKRNMNFTVLCKFYSTEVYLWDMQIKLISLSQFLCFRTRLQQ